VRHPDTQTVWVIKSGEPRCVDETDAVECIHYQPLADHCPQCSSDYRDYATNNGGF